MSQYTKEHLRQVDTRHLWHPYTDIDAFENTDTPIVKHASGCYFYDMEGKRYLDGIASWWCVNFGHSHPALVRAIQEQSQKLQHVILGGLSHEVAILLSEKLAKITPGELDHCYFASDGASSVEASLRIALEYWENNGFSQKKRFISLEDAYHGDTLGAIGVGYLATYHRKVESVIAPNYRARSPHCTHCPFQKEPESCNTECFSSMESLVQKHHATVAAVIIEPLCQGSAGIRIYPEAYLKKLETLCKRYGILLIADEIAVGFYRTGARFACEKASVKPDILLLGKGLTGGYLPMSAAVVTSTIYDSFRKGNTFYHGHTFCGNPIAAHLALTAIELYETLGIERQIPQLSTLMANGLQAITAQLDSSSSQVLGMVGRIELGKTAGGALQARAIAQKAMQLGLFIRPLGNVLYLWPPLTITEEELKEALGILMQAVAEA